MIIEIIWICSYINNFFSYLLIMLHLLIQNYVDKCNACRVQLCLEESNFLAFIASDSIPWNITQSEAFTMPSKIVKCPSSNLGYVPWNSTPSPGLIDSKSYRWRAATISDLVSHCPTRYAILVGPFCSIHSLITSTSNSVLVSSWASLFCTMIFKFTEQSCIIDLVHTHRAWTRSFVCTSGPEHQHAFERSHLLLIVSQSPL